MNILPYTVRIMRKDSTVINRLPSSVTAQSGMESQKLTALILSTISDGRAAPLVRPPAAVTVEIVPCATEKIAIMRSSPYPTAALASTKRTKSLTAASGRFNSVRLPHVLTTPAAKNSTSSP